MAKILDVPTSGSIADRVHSHNRAGQYIRNRRAPTQPVGTGRRAVARANFGAASAGYGALTSAQQEAWASYADAYPYTDALGQSIKLTGHQMYVAINANRLNVGLDQSVTPPTTNETPAFTDVSFTPDLSSGFDIQWSSDVEGAYALIAFSKPLSGGRKFNKTWWQQQVAASEATSVIVPVATYAAQFGAPVAGQRVMVKLTPISAEGVAGVPTVIIGTVQA